MKFYRFLPLFAINSILSFSVLAQTDSTANKQNAPSQGATHTVQPQQNTGSITGKIVDAQNQPVSYATVTLLRSDSSVVNGDLSKDDGTFNISPTGIGSFTLRIAAIGLATKDMNVQITSDAPQKKIGTIKISSATHSLKGVDVVAEKPVIEMHVDKKVFNVASNITTAGGSASDVLSNVPSVSVDVDGNVSLRGNANVTILIDGKPATLLGSDQVSALQSLPASSIDNVEVITNPGAKYDAQGPTGIINIITKKDNKLGINGNITLGASTGDKYNGNLGLNVRKGKWNVFLNSSFRLNSNYNNTTTDIYGKGADTTSSHSFEHAQRHFDGYFNSIGASYDINKNNSITFTQNVNVMNFGYTDTSNFKTYGAQNQTNLQSMEQRYSNAHGGPVSLSSALDYKGKFKKKGEEIDVDATYAVSNISRTTNYLTGVDSYNGGNYSGPISETAPGTGNNETFNGSIDYTDPLFTENGKLGLGVKSQLYWFSSTSNPLIDTAGGPQYVDKTLLNNFNYTQQVNAAYVNWNDQLGKFSYQVGLRAEANNYSGTDFALSDTKYTNNYFDLFPSAFVSYQLPKQQSIYLSYSRRTNRPGFFQLLPYKDMSNPSVVSEGNPALVPEFINNIELAYSYANKRGDNIIFSAYYTYTQHLIEKLTRPVTAADSLPSSYPIGIAQFSQPVNLASGTTYGLEATGHVQIVPGWDATLNFNFFQNQINVGNVDPTYSLYLSNTSGFSWFGKINTTIKLPAGFSLQLNGDYESAKPIAQGTLKEVYWMDAAIRKNLLKNKASVVINCSDVFNTRKYTTDYNFPTYTETYYRDRETRVLGVTLTYRFGKSDVGGKGGRKSKPTNTTGPQNQDDRENNLKQGGDDDNSGGGSGNGGGGSGGNHGAHN